MTDQHQALAADPWTRDLEASITGRVIGPGDGGYDEARQVFNAAVDRRPAAIVQVTDEADVAHAVSFARDRGLGIAVKGGAHSFAGHGVRDGGIVLDMSALDGLEIDVEGRAAWAQAGLTAGEYTAATGRHGLATGFGDTGTVGVAGITLGGGIGWLVRKHGLTIDQLLAVEVVTADGELRVVDAEREPDLFWALRGGGGNFGVVTGLRYRLHEVDPILGGALILPATADVVRGFAEVTRAAPDELSTIGHIARVPPLPFVPAEHHGRLALTAMLVFAGGPEAGVRAIAPLRALAEPIADHVSEMPYPDIYRLGEGGPQRAAMAVRTGFRDELDEGAIDAILSRLAARVPHMAVVQLRPLGGAVARVASDATAYAHRDRGLMVVCGAVSEQPGDAAMLRSWVDETATGLELPGSGAYVNYLAEDGDARIGEAYPGATYDRLVAIKRRYDPDNLFRSNQNIAP